MLTDAQSLPDLLIKTAQQFRLGQEAQGSVSWRQCLDNIEANYPELPFNLTFKQLVPEMLAAQERQDWLCLADYLEYELTVLVALPPTSKVN